MEIAGRTALVTGAGIGTGRAIALALAAEGADVVASDVDEAGGHETVAMCAGNARFVKADLTDAEELRRLIDQAAPTILVNNAGGAATSHFPDAAPDEWEATLDLNLRAPMLGTQLALPRMREAGRGAIVNVASTAGVVSERYQ